MLGYGKSRSRNDERRGGRDIERATAVTTGSARVDQAVWRSVPRSDMGGARAHRPRESCHLASRLAFHAQGHQEGGRKRGRGFAPQDLQHRRIGLPFGQVLAGRRTMQRLLNCGHGALFAPRFECRYSGCFGRLG